MSVNNYVHGFNFIICSGFFFPSSNLVFFYHLSTIYHFVDLIELHGSRVPFKTFNGNGKKKFSTSLRPKCITFVAVCVWPFLEQRMKYTAFDRKRLLLAHIIEFLWINRSGKVSAIAIANRHNC